MVFVPKQQREAVSTQALYHTAVAASQEAFCLNCLENMLKPGSDRRTWTFTTGCSTLLFTCGHLAVTQEQRSKQFADALKEAEKRRRLEQREDRDKSRREKIRADRKAEREEMERGGLGPKGQAAIDNVNKRMDTIEDTLQQLLFEVKSQSRARKFFASARR